MLRYLTHDLIFIYRLHQVFKLGKTVLAVIQLLDVGFGLA